MRDRCQDGRSEIKKTMGTGVEHNNLKFKNICIKFAGRRDEGGNGRRSIIKMR